MKKLLSLGVIVLITANAGATLLFYDGFDYTPGELLAPKTDTTASPNPGQYNITYDYNWRYTGAGGTLNNAPGINTGGLSYAGLEASTGNSVLFDTTHLGAARIQVTPTAITSGTVYWSGLLQVGNVANLNAANGMLLGGFNNAIGAGTLPTVANAVLRIRQDSTDTSKYNIGVGLTTGTTAGIIQWSGAFAALQTVFVVASYEFIAGANNDAARMWINPDASTFGAASPPTVLLTSAPGGSVADATSVYSFHLRNVNTVGTPTGVLFDELRVGTTWAAVTPVPEPMAAALLGLGSLAITGWYRSRRH